MHRWVRNNDDKNIEGLIYEGIRSPVVVAVGEGNFYNKGIHKNIYHLFVQKCLVSINIVSCKE